ncbi:MAG TPA: DUF4115 domain-containing protein [Bryobacteraceae bacterium]|nr:DUF4115 domain-containing protein [Bryobacteraceae bacterium]
MRVRIELSRGGIGVPLHKLASVVQEAHKFFQMLAEDVHIDGQRGEWLGFDFDNQSLNFTAEYVGAVTPKQVQAFYAAFDGTTALRRATIAQFARITDAIGEDELIGFGLYPSEHDSEPSEWRCLSRRDALRISEEIQVLIGANPEQSSHLPAVSDAGSSLFGKNRDEDPGLAARLARVERKVDEHSAHIRDLRAQSAAAEESFRNLLSAVEGFCDQAAQQIERITPAAALPPSKRRVHRWVLAGIGGVIVAGALFAGWKMWPAHPVEPVLATTAPAERPVPEPAPAAEPVPAPTAAQVARAEPMHVEISASEPSWVALTGEDGRRLFVGLISPGEPKTFDLEQDARLRTGNAGGLAVKLNGQALGTIGPHGKVREIEFKDNTFTILTPE